MQCVYCVGVKRKLHFHYVLQLVQWLARLIVTNQDCILIIQNIIFSNILCNPKLR